MSCQIVIENDDFKDEKSNVIIDIHDEKSFEDTIFSFSTYDILFLEHNSSKIKFEASIKRCSFNLTTEGNFCSGKLLHLQAYFATVTVHQLEDVVTARSYHSKYKLCKTTYSYRFTVDKRLFLPLQPITVHSFLVDRVRGRVSIAFF